jgi:hypothetical protein
VSEPLVLVEVADRGTTLPALESSRAAFSDDAREGIAAFFETRPPRFTGG